ncbi:unnamed protein product [Strongylus vulgaris]|uniref:Uncharacterized protein n=1 Tax=Strongylus vulgaris TaxID=40348 RepID=A0A3P7JHE2_STRVU|nr:unnamed protein product [Strongylus vulgaris]
MLSCCSIANFIKVLSFAIIAVVRRPIVICRFIRNVCLWFGYPAIDESGLWDDDLSQLLVSIMDLFIIIDKYGGNSEEILGAWRTYFDLLNTLPVEFWRQMPARNWLEEMAHRLEHLGNSRSHNVTSQIYESNSAQVFAPALWEECEKRSPPCDYRTLCEIPVMKDICNAEASYLRRAIISGHYQDAAHYIDVQFRLFREDLVSPLRDGLAVYKLNATTRYQKWVEDDSQPSSDLIVFEVEAIEGVQVRPSDGTLFRYAKLTDASRNHPAFARNLMFGQCVCLSCDDFREDYHLARIVEREDTGILAFTSMDENDAIVKNRVYHVAEPQSYLIAYQHVLLSLKDFSPCSPIPFERYLVYGKCDVRKPFYMRIDEDVEEVLDDAEIRKYYEDVRKDIRASIAKNPESYE